MTQLDERDRRIEEMERFLARLLEASLRINDSLELDDVLLGTLDGALALTGARYGVMTTLDESGNLEDLLASGLTPEQSDRMFEMPGGLELFAYLNSIPGPARVDDFPAHARELGLPEFAPPVPMIAYLSAPILHRGEKMGIIHIAKGEPGDVFSQTDEDTLVMFASQAALVIANARRYRDERRARATLETLVETTLVGVMVFDAPTGEPLSVNREAARIADRLTEPDQTPENLIEALTVRRADGREFSLAEWPLAEALSAGETVRAEEITLSVPNGNSVSALLNATPIRDDDGEIESFVVTMQDMTQLEEQERLRAEFLGMVSHELRTPLTSIKGSAVTMLDSADNLDPAEFRQFLRIIVNQADAMRDLIGDLLDAARIQTGSLSVSLEPCEVAALVDRARNTFLSGGGRNNLHIELAPDLPLVTADRRRVAQVIGNLLSNAARYSPNSSPIRVTAARDGINVAISVADEGRGIPSEQMPRLFRKFGGNAVEALGGDTGLGLSISKGIVEAHGGRIWAESEGPGLGARFTFTLPAVHQDVVVEMPPTPRQPQEDSADGPPVLVVDDDPQTLLYVRNALSGAGYRPIVTPDHEDAHRLMVENRPHLVLLDMMLPGSNGIDLMGDLASVSDAPVIFISAYGGDQMIARALEAGGADYIVKPFSPTELVARVGTALRLRKAPYQTGPMDPYELADLFIDYAERRVVFNGEPLHLTAMEYGLLTALASNGGRVMTHERLLRRVWAPGKRGDVRALRTLLRRLRVKLEEHGNDPTYIFSVPHVGYRMPRSEWGNGGDS